MEKTYVPRSWQTDHVTMIKKGQRVKEARNRGNARTSVMNAGKASSAFMILSNIVSLLRLGERRREEKKKGRE